jgi:hypothetical protein
MRSVTGYRRKRDLDIRPYPEQVRIEREQSVVANLQIALFPATHLSFAESDDFSRLLPGNLLTIARMMTSCTFIARSTAALR